MCFRYSLEVLINAHSKENGSNTPDYILADFLTSCLASFDKAVKEREEWYGIKTGPATIQLNNLNPKQPLDYEETLEK